MNIWAPTTYVLKFLLHYVAIGEPPRRDLQESHVKRRFKQVPTQLFMDEQMARVNERPANKYLTVRILSMQLEKQNSLSHKGHMDKNRIVEINFDKTISGCVGEYMQNVDNFVI